MVPNLYVKGFVLEKMNSSEDFGEDSDEKDDCVLKRLVVQAKQNEIGDWELVGYIELETVWMIDGLDLGGIEMPVEVYRMPFPWDFHVRVTMLKEMKKKPKFFADS